MGRVPLEDRLLAGMMRRRMRRLARQRAGEAGEERFSATVPAVFADQEQLIHRYAPGRSFLDVACLWRMHGGCAFVAEEAGAASVVASDVAPASPEFEAEHARRDSGVTFVQANLHSLEDVEALGKHDVVWCSGFLYHTQLPWKAMGHLIHLAGSYLIVGSKVIPDVPGLPGAAVCYAGLPDEQRSAYAPISSAVASGEYERERGTANWFWGLSPEAIKAMASALGPVEVVEELHLPWRRRHDSYYVVLRVS